MNEEKGKKEPPTERRGQKLNRVYCSLPMGLSESSVVLAPSKTTGKCQMENFKGESSLMSWVKSACLYYCYNKFKRKKRIPLIESLPNPNEEKYDDPDRFIDLGGSSELVLQIPIWRLVFPSLGQVQILLAAIYNNE